MRTIVFWCQFLILMLYSLEYSYPVKDIMLHNSIIIQQFPLSLTDVNNNNSYELVLPYLWRICVNKTYTMQNQ